MSDLSLAEQESPHTEPPKSTTQKIEANLSTWIAITTVLLAVFATLASFKAAGYGNKMVLAQSMASDQWAYYQAKSIKETAYTTSHDLLVLAAAESPTNLEAARKAAEYKNVIDRYKQEKSEIEAKAKSLEAERESAQNLNSMFGQALIFLQVGILLTSLASINKALSYWALGAGFGAVGIIYFVYTLLQTW